MRIARAAAGAAALLTGLGTAGCDRHAGQHCAAGHEGAAPPAILGGGWPHPVPDPAFTCDRWVPDPPRNIAWR